MAFAARFHAFINSIGKPSDAARVRSLQLALRKRLADLHLDTEEGRTRLADDVARQVAPAPFSDAVAELLLGVLEFEGHFRVQSLPAEPTTAQLWDMRAALERQLRVLEDVEFTKRSLALFLREILPDVGMTDEKVLFHTPLYGQISELPHYLDHLITSVCAEVLRDVLFETGERVTRNLTLVDPKQVRLPSRSQLTNPDQLIGTYLGGTPFSPFLRQTIPLPVTQETFFSHMHVVGGSNAGKTQWLSQLILHHLDQASPPSLIVVDSQGDLIDKLSHLEVFEPDKGRLADRLIIISPKDIQYPPSINVFDINRDRLTGYDQALREQVVAGVIQTFDYLFTGLIGADLTAKQSVFFRFVARLLLSIPSTMGRNATILDMIDLMEDHTKYAAAIAELPTIPRRFFERDFPSATFKQTKEQIRYRLNAILENPTLERLFTSPTTKVDLFREMNRGSIILIDTAKDFLKGASGNFGRIFISLVLQAALERAAIPERQRRAALLVVDEAADYFDSNIDDLLTEARKYKLGCVFAHQFLDQCTPALRASLAANTSMKLAGGVSMADARALAPDLRTTADFIASQPRLHFACHIRNVTQTAISMPVQAGMLERRPRLSAGAYEELLERNRARVHERSSAASEDPPPPPRPPKQSGPETDETAPSEW